MQNPVNEAHGRITIHRRLLCSAAAAALLWSMAGSSLAASIWNPTLLVNTESFNTIDDGDSTTNIQMRFGDALRETITFNRTLWRFEFSQSIYVGGNVTATGSLSIKKVMSGAALRVDNNADIWGNLAVSGATLVDGNLSTSGALAVEGAAAFGSTLKLNGVTYTFPAADGGANHVLQTNGAGTLSWTDVGVSAQAHNDARYVNQAGDTMTGALLIRPTTAGEAALEVDGTASGRILSFANRLTGSGSVTIRTLTDSQTAFQVLDNDGGTPVFNIDTASERVGIGTATPDTALDVVGTISGSIVFASNSLTSSGTIAVEGNAAFGGTIKLGGVTYTFPGTAGTNGQALVTDGVGTLSWAAPSSGVGSGGVIFLSPEYPHAVYVGSGSSYVGQLSAAYDATNKENYYHWTSSKATPLQEYTIAVRVRVPDNFSAWDANRPVQLRYRTGTADNTENLVSLRMQDTAGAWVTLSSNENLASTSWATATILGPQAAGTYTKTGYITLFIKLATKSTGSADAGFINLNWETTAP